MISVRHLSKSYINPDGSKFQVLKDVNCEIGPGEVISIIGPSGTGKSTFLRMLNLLEHPSGGEIWVDGENILRKGYPIHKLRRKMGMVFQSFNLFEHMSVLDNVTYAPCKLLGMSREEAENEAMALLRKVGMAEKAGVSPSTLSGGQKQRVAIAGVLAMKPKILIFDEATSMLDPQGKDEIKKVIRQIHEESSLTILSITHDIDEVAQSDHVIALNKGKIAMSGTPHEVFTDEKKLKEIQLDIPFALKFRNALARRGVQTDAHITMEGLVKELCRSDSNM